MRGERGIRFLLFPSRLTFRRVSRQMSVRVGTASIFLVIYHIPIWDRMEREISDALLPVAFSAA